MRLRITRSPKRWLAPVNELDDDDEIIIGGGTDELKVNSASSSEGKEPPDLQGVPVSERITLFAAQAF